MGEARPLGAPEGSQSSSVAEAAGARADTLSDTRQASRWFFLAAALIALADTAIAPRFMHELPNALVVAAFALALAGLVVDFAIGPRRTAPARLRLLERALASDGWCAFAVGILFLAFYGATTSPPTAYNEHARLAWALLHGHTWVDAPSYMEHVVV
ncbi:MAG: hypothetical protein ACREPW_02430, partial [Candidatus Binataceae bacterium]